MTIIVNAIGKLKKNTPEVSLIDMYLTRLQGKVQLKEFEEKRLLTGKTLAKAETTLLLSNVSPDTVLFVLDEQGQEYTSPEFAALLKSYLDIGKTVTFCIGGAAGHSPTIREKADKVISLGKMTLPHSFARVVLIEQLYRAHTIWNNHPYHK